ncbi:hypothetical protein BDZ89DRAFT_426331 [Hymenopellis radicata]|nr:hypothetical protein BDZ89DRAFT_426331 [Hymenopellis radicata]
MSGYVSCCPLSFVLARLRWLSGAMFDFAKQLPLLSPILSHIPLIRISVEMPGGEGNRSQRATAVVVLFLPTYSHQSTSLSVAFRRCKSPANEAALNTRSIRFLSSSSKSPIQTIRRLKRSHTVAGNTGCVTKISSVSFLLISATRAGDGFQRRKVQRTTTQCIFSMPSPTWHLIRSVALQLLPSQALILGNRPSILNYIIFQLNSFDLLFLLLCCMK